MIETGIISKFDDLGRIVIPRTVRQEVFGTHDIKGKSMEFFYEKDGTIILKPIEEQNQRGKYLMKIYIVERDNPSYKPEPEVFTDGKIALATVKREYEDQMKELGTSKEIADAGYGSCGCYWSFEDGEYCGDCLIDQDCDGDRWEWRITEHEVGIQ